MDRDWVSSMCRVRWEGGLVPMCRVVSSCCVIKTILTYCKLSDTDIQGKGLLKNNVFASTFVTSTNVLFGYRLHHVA